MIKRIVTAVVALAVTAVAFFATCCDGKKDTLLLYDSDTGKVYGEFSVGEGSEFAVEFIHSVNKKPLIDVYVIKNEEIYVDRTIYAAFGAGVQSELEDGQTLEYDEKGNIVVSGFDTPFPKVTYVVGTVSDHILHIGGESISLTELCGKNAHVTFELK